MKRIKKNKKIYFIIILILVIIIALFIYAKIIEAPIPATTLTTTIEQPIINEEVKSAEETLPIKEKVEINNGEKYKIIKEGVIAPENKANKKKTVLLTVDDGPSIRTKEMLSILNKHKAKAIFFINGMHDKNNKGVIKEINDEGFAIGNHTWSHLNLKREKDKKMIEKEINRNTDLIAKITGAPPRFFRPPYGESNAYVKSLVKDDGMIFMNWSGAAKDWEKSTVEKDVFVNNVMKDLHSGEIILIHEHPWSVANLDALLTDLESKGYTYVDPRDIIE